MPKQSGRSPAAFICPEAELLLCCARTCLDFGRTDVVKDLIRQNIDWAYLIRISLLHGIMPLLSQNLTKTCPELVPREILGKVQDYFYANAARNLLLTWELLKLLDLLKTHEISALPFKGPVLAASVYGDLSLRQFSDLDILVHKRDVLKAKDIFLSHGYRPTHQLTDAQQEAYLQSKRPYNYKFVSDDSRVFVELHWEFTSRFNSFPLDYDRLWQRLQPVCLGEKTVLNLPPEDLLLILCQHGSKHLWSRLQWICDVAELIRAHPAMAWGTIVEQANVVGSKRMLFLGLRLATDLLETTLPQELLQTIQSDSAVRALAMRVRKQLFSEAHGPPSSFERHVFYLKMRERLQDRIVYCFHHLQHYLNHALRLMAPNANDQRLLRFPKLLSFLYYLLRPIRLIGVYGLSPLIKYPRQILKDLVRKS